MELRQLVSILQNYCHEGKSLDRVILKYGDKHLVLNDVTVTNGKNEEDVVIDLTEEEK